MKFKTSLKPIFIIILLLVFLFTVYFIYFKCTEVKEESFISSDFLFVFQTKNLFTLFNKLNESQLLDTVFYDKHTKEFYEILMGIRSQLSKTKQGVINFINFPATVVIHSDKKPLAIFNTGLKTPLFKITSIAMQKMLSDSIDVRFKTTKYNSYKIIKVTLLSKRESFYFCQIKNILLVAMDKAAIKKVIDRFISKNNLLENENYLQVRSQIGDKKTLSVYFNMKYILDEMNRISPDLYKSMQSLLILSIAGIDLEIAEETILINGFFSTESKDMDVNKLFLSTPKKNISFELLPEKTDSFISITFDNFQDIWNYYKRILKSTGQKEKYQTLKKTEQTIEKMLNLSLEELLFSWLDDEITFGSVSGFKDPVSIISIKNSDMIDQSIKKLQKKNILNKFSKVKYKEYTLYQIQLSSFFRFLSDVISPDLSLPYYTVYDDFIILSKNKELIKFVLDSLDKDDLLYYNNKVKKLTSYIKKGNIITYWDISRNSDLFSRSKNLFTKIIKNYNYGMASINFSDKGLKTKIIITEPQKEHIKLVEGWPLEFDSTVWTTPLVYNIDNKNLDEIIIGTENGKIYLTDLFGDIKLNWPVKVDGKLTTSPFLLKEGNTDIAIGTASSSGKIYIWNKEGVLKNNFPLDIDIKGHAMASLVGDLNNDNSPEIIISGDKGEVYAYHSDGSIMPGFPVQLKEKVKSDIFLLNSDLYNGKEIMCSTYGDNGYIYFINNTGTINEENIFASGSVCNLSTSVANLSQGKISIIQLTRDGKLFIRKKDGSFAGNFPIDLKQKFVTPPAVSDINNDGLQEIIVISSKGMLSVIKNTGKILSEYLFDFRPVENEKILLFDINKNGIKEIIIPDADDYIRFYTSNGRLLFKLKGSTTPVIKDMDGDGRLEIVTAGDNKKVYLYKMP